ncbi:MAG: zinc carboxypeptidase [Elusimicrobia bacterium]|nr:zinc carboxypeptidase [Elusimicrobiota bacterium]
MKPIALALTAALCALTPASFAAEASFDAKSSKPAAFKFERKERVAKPAAEDDRLWITATVSGASGRTAVVNAGISIEEIAADSVGGVGNARMTQRLTRLGIPFKAVPLAQRFHAEDFPAEDAAFHNYQRLTADLQGLVAASGGLASLFSIGGGWQGDKQIWCLRLNTTAKGEEKSNKPAIVYMGTHHAREHLSTEVPFLLAKYLVENRDKPEIAGLLAKRDVYIIPMINPDGAEYDIATGQYRMHRKNTRDNGGGSVGVDLNRNYGYHWGEGGSSGEPDSDIYHGPSAFSEPETQAVKKFVEDRLDTLKILLTFHSFSELILYPWGHKNGPLDDTKAQTAYETLAKTMAQWNGYTPEHSSDLYIASGDTTDWAWGAHKIFAFTFELTPKSMWDGGFYPGAGAISSTFAANLKPALYLLDLADDPYRASAPLGLTRAQPSNPTTGGR